MGLTAEGSGDKGDETEGSEGEHERVVAPLTRFFRAVLQLDIAAGNLFYRQVAVHWKIDNHESSGLALVQNFWAVLLLGDMSERHYICV